jgi:hypothetical protein
MHRYKHGEVVKNWRYRWGYIQNPDYNPHLQFRKDDYWFRDPRLDEFVRGQTNERIYYGEVYRFRMDPISRCSKNRKGRWSKYDRNKGSGKCWKREWYAARADAKEIYEEYGITFKNSKQIPYRQGYNHQHGWKRSKKKKQWM